MVREKVRIRFSKTGNLRFISHHDLMRCFERMLRRAALPFHSSQGFNPRPRLVFALPLPLGMAGIHEAVDLELDEQVAALEILSRLANVSPVGLQILDVEPVDPHASTCVHHVTYRVPFTALEPVQDLHERVRTLLAEPEIWIERLRPKKRRVEIRSFIMGLRIDRRALEMDILVTPNGTARPDEVLARLGLTSLIEEGVVIERTAVELCHEGASFSFAEVGSNAR
jgi:radical SAM-linked protein